MAANSEAEKMMLKLLIHNKLITKTQVQRVLKLTIGRSNKKLPEELVDRYFVDPAVMKKVTAAVDAKGLVFPLLCDQSA